MGRFRSILKASLVLAICFAAFRFTSAQINSAEDESRQSASDVNSGTLIAILGEVARPGVYRAPFEEPYLLDLVENAGGLTERATGYLRVIRQTENGAQAMYASGRDFQLKRGDVVVANREMELLISPRSDAGGEDSLNATAVDESRSEFVQLAFVNLVDRPIVLKMRRENAQVRKILEFLGQSADRAGSMLVVAPGSTPTPAAADQPLVSESVLVFDPTALQLSQWPSLPTAIANAAPPAEPAVPAAHIASTDADSGLDRESTLLVDGGEPAEGGVPLPPPLHLDPLEADGEDLRTVMMMPEQTTPAISEKRIPDFTLVSNPLEPPAESTIDASDSAGLGGWILVLLTLAGGAAAGWGIVRKLKDRTSRTLATSTRELEKMAAPLDLDEILNDQLPVVEELALSSTRRIQVSRAAEQSSIRADVTHESPQPHIATETAAPSPAEPAVAAGSEIDQLRFDSPHEEDDSRRAPSQQRRAAAGGSAGLLDRVLSRVQEGSRR